ncbi:MAG: 16S rRNA (cytosine(967)-C(5))-methyltransferase RsmB [Verrucomicrobiota bacterium]
MPSTRHAAFQILSRWERSPGHVYAEALIAEHFEQHSHSTQDAALIKTMVLGVLQSRSILDHWIDQWSKGKVSNNTRRLLRIGLYQVLFMRVPDHAAVNETVALSRNRSETKFVNAILRRATREKDSALAAQESLPAHIRFSLPEFIIKRWTSNFGSKTTVDIGQVINSPAPLFMRLNKLKPDATTHLPEDASPSLTDDRFYRLESLPSKFLDDGYGYIQDPSTAMACDLLAPAPNDKILDACAAPGGKTCLLAEKMDNSGSIIAGDSSESRLNTLAANIHRLGVTNTATCLVDWTKLAPSDVNKSFPHQFDKILVDAPCSNTGVLRRRHDARWRISPESIEAITRIQSVVLTNILPLLRAGGHLVYSTCSIEPEENQDLVQELLTNHQNLALVRENTLLPTPEHDGAYAALIVRN